MPWSPIVNLYLNLDAYGNINPFLSDLTLGSARTASPTWVARDKFLLRIWPRQVAVQQGAPTTSVQLVGDALLIAGKLASALAGSTLLFEADDFTENVSGSDYYYETLLNLDTANLQSASFSGARSLNALVDLDIQLADATEGMRFQFALTINSPVWQGESTPEPMPPAYPLPSQILTKDLVGVFPTTAGQQDYDLDLTTHSLSSAISGLLTSIGQVAGASSIQPVWITDASVNTAVSTRVHLDAPPLGTEKVVYQILK